MSKTALPPTSAILIGVVLIAAITVAAVAVWALRPHGELGSGLPDTFTYRVDEYTAVAPELLRWREVQAIPAGLAQPRALALGADDEMFVAGDRAVVSFNAEGEPLGRIDLDAEPRRLAIAAQDHARPGRLYVVFRTHVEVYRTDGTRETAWPHFDTGAALTGIALAADTVFVADAGRRIVLQCDLDGKVLNEIGRRDEEREIPGFVIPSPYFDLTLGPDGLLRVVNPGRHRIEYYTQEGRLELPLIWGRAGVAIDGFCGCCNPASIALLPDGRMVTAEKGILRVKVYTEQGELQSVVAGPAELAPTPGAMVETRTDYRLRAPMVAVDSRARVLVLDPASGAVRIFEEIQ